MPGWLSAATVAASRWTRWRKLPSLEYCSASTLMATGMSRRGCVERYTTPMAPRPSSASIGYRPGCVVLKFALGETQYARRCGAFRPNWWLVEGRYSPLGEDAQRHVERDAEVGLVHDLADPEVAGQAAQDVCVLPAELVVRLQPGDRVANCVASVLHQVGPEGRNRVVAGSIAPRLQRLRGREEVVAPGAQPAAFHHSKAE